MFPLTVGCLYSFQYFFILSSTMNWAHIGGQALGPSRGQSNPIPPSWSLQCIRGDRDMQSTSGCYFFSGSRLLFPTCTAYNCICSLGFCNKPFSHEPGQCQTPAVLYLCRFIYSVLKYISSFYFILLVIARHSNLLKSFKSWSCHLFYLPFSQFRFLCKVEKDDF